MTKNQIIQEQSKLILELIRICGEKVKEATELFFEIEKHVKEKEKPKKAECGEF